MRCAGLPAFSSVVEGAAPSPSALEAPLTVCAFADVILCNVQRVRVPLVQVRNKEFPAFQSFHQPMRCLLLLYLYFDVVCRGNHQYLLCRNIRCIVLVSCYFLDIILRSSHNAPLNRSFSSNIMKPEITLRLPRLRLEVEGVKIT